MKDKNKLRIDDYLRLAQQKDLGFEEICEIIQVPAETMKTILSSVKYVTYINEKAKEFKMTVVDEWHTVDKYISDGFSDENIANLLNIPVRQIEMRRHFLQKHLI